MCLLGFFSLKIKTNKKIADTVAYKFARPKHAEEEKQRRVRLYFSLKYQGVKSFTSLTHWTIYALFTHNKIQPDKYRSVIQFSIVSMVTD